MVLDKRKPSETSQLGARKRAREDSEPTEEDAQSTFFTPFSLPTPHSKTDCHPIRPKSNNQTTPQKHAHRNTHRLQKVPKRHRHAPQHDLTTPLWQHFPQPHQKTEAPDYHDIVKRPMDLKTIKSRVKDGWITNSSEFQRDVYLMFANAMMYNRPGSEIYNMAEEMMLESETHITTFRQTEGFHRM